MYEFLCQWFSSIILEVLIFFLKYVEHAACKLAESTDSLKIELKKNLPKCVPLICKYWGGGGGETIIPSVSWVSSISNMLTTNEIHVYYKGFLFSNVI